MYGERVQHGEASAEHLPLKWEVSPGQQQISGHVNNSASSAEVLGDVIQSTRAHFSCLTFLVTLSHRGVDTGFY